MSGSGFFSDTKLQTFVISLIPHISAFIETGTCEGDTARWMAERCQRVFTCETNYEYLAALKETLPPNVTLFELDSPKFLERIYADVGKLPLFFLDAHWNAYWPLLDELIVIGILYGKAVIIVHDCAVPGHPNFWTCRGGGGDNVNGPICDWDYIKRGLDRRHVYRLFYPTYLDQTPGWCVLFMNTALIGDMKDLEESNAVLST